MALMTGCVKTKYETRVEYVHPEIPQSLLEPCDSMLFDISTNGELLMSFVSLQSAYMICSAKVTSISEILKGYMISYSSDEVNIKNQT